VSGSTVLDRLQPYGFDEYDPFSTFARAVFPVCSCSTRLRFATFAAKSPTIVDGVSRRENHAR
jgi:hypothetical protein